ncbi:MAG: 50S ribosomal protein L11 [Candidatus Liptonbacteria bacterium RIFCSPLOWO2_01_FULL_52_25]|uniref:Large ribosomal subunit protein uL11 n=1 Tax=Candidatus Liptonbacteria bacterium RIFCSPLOWO2_01_FULL_52_25 TaxID=1798650 RepID=A0A1G2CIF4_9BACT|nr:MAG: 50S ribosomal protein L11 [Candidatus Liptonbacteria bacterium RIFCSPLOWO2_01_FULL_52_25]
MAKKIKTVLKIQIEAGKATPAPPIGTALGPQGINIQDFCKKFNDATKNMTGDVVPAQITIFEDRSFTFILKTPPASALLKKAAGIEKGSGNALTTKVGKVSRAEVRKIAERKMPDMNANDLDAAERIIRGTAKNMGIEVTD